MFRIIRRIQELNFRQLMNVYAESIQQECALHYPHLDDWQSLLEAEQDYYAFMRAFLKMPDAALAVWEEDGVYYAGLRLEPYRDGVLLEGLETAPNRRRRGYAKALLKNVVNYLIEKKCGKLYSHVDHANLKSIRLHEACNFKKLYDHAVFVDGSVDYHTSTYVLDIKSKVQF